MDIILLIHKATLELYGIELEMEKTAKLAGLLLAVARGERTFLDSENEKNNTVLRQEGESDGIDMNQLFHEARMQERNAARRLSGMPLET